MEEGRHLFVIFSTSLWSYQPNLLSTYVFKIVDIKEKEGFEVAYRAKVQVENMIKHAYIKA